MAPNRYASLDTTGAAVTATGKACVSQENYLAQSQVHVIRQGDVVRGVIQLPEEVQGIGILNASLDRTVDVPAGLAVVVTDSSGDVHVSNVKGTVNAPK